MFFIRRPSRPTVTSLHPLQLGGKSVELHCVRNPRARRYLLRLKGDGTVRLTIPRGGSESAGWLFLQRHLDWLEAQQQKLAARPPKNGPWILGTEILYRGTLTKLQPATEPGAIRLGDLLVRIPAGAEDLRLEVERQLRRLAGAELPPRLQELARLHGLTVRKVSVRNQRSRWGSCSRRGTISLNWRLIQLPPSVADYILLHELMHLREMNHSRRFWAEVEKACPNYRAAEAWLKAHRRLALL